MTIDINEYLLIPPNWDNGIKYKRIWNTGIQLSINAMEKRSALFTWSRLFLSFSILTMSASETNYMIRKFYKSLHLVWGIPYWPDRIDLTSQAALGQAVLNVEDTTNLNFAVDGKCIIIIDENTYEAGTILSMTTNTITLDANLSDTWVSGTMVYPVLKARLQIKQSADVPLAGHTIFEIDANEVPDVDVTHVPMTTSSFPIKFGLPVFDLLPDWSSGLKLQFHHNFESLKFLGPEFTLSTINESALDLDMQFLQATNAETNEVLAFFDDNKGRWGTFLIPSQMNDIVITEDFVSTDTIFTIEDIDWSTYWDEMTSMGHILQFRFPDGSAVYRTIVGATGTSMTITPAIGENITESALPNLTVSFLYQVRFNMDEIEVLKVTDTISKFNLRFRTVYNDGVDIVTPCTVFGATVCEVDFAIGEEDPSYSGGGYDGISSATGIDNCWYAWETFPKNTGWTGQDFGVDNFKIIVQYSLISFNDTERSYDPKDWTFEASDTGAWGGEEVVLDTQTDQSFTQMEQKDYSISNNTAYRYYRLNVTANNGHGSYLIIPEIEMSECVE